MYISGKKTYKNWYKEVFYKEIKKVWNDRYGSWNTLLIDEDKYKVKKYTFFIYSS